jgi:hypothetical protein
VGVNTTYIGRVDIVPGLNQSEYDYLRAFAESRRSYRPAGPYALEPMDPDYGTSARAVDRHNQIADGQPGYWCQWVPCPHGCCLGWNGREKFYAGPAWMRYLIDHFLRPDAHARASGDPQFTGFTFDHQMDGIIVGEQQDNLELFAIRVEQNEVTQEILRRGLPQPWDPDWDGLYVDDRPWLAGERPPRWSSLEEGLPGLPADLGPAPPLNDIAAAQSRPRRRRGRSVR